MVIDDRLFMVGPVVISMKIKRLTAFWFKTLHMWRLPSQVQLVFNYNFMVLRHKGITVSKILLVDPVTISM